MKGIFLPLLLSIVCASAWAQTIFFEGRLTDPAFRDDGPARVELLESGEAKEVEFGGTFALELPADTAWNLCLSSSAREKCYELRYGGNDSAFSLEISGALRTTVYEEREGGAPVAETVPEPAGADSVDVDALLAEADGGRVEMKKVLVQLVRRPKRKIGESVVSTKSIKRMPGLAEADVIRSVQALPGVVASSDFSTKIYVRGGAADQNLFLFDNAVVYSPVHFFGLFSTFLVETIGDVSFHKSGFPARYGNRLSSVLAMDSRAGGSDSTEAWFERSSVKFSTFAGQAHTEGRKGRARWVVAGRTSYIGPVLRALNWADVVDFELLYNFVDLQGALHCDLNDDMKLKTSFYYGHDVLDFDPIYLGWGNFVLPVNFDWRITDRVSYSATLAYTSFYQDMELADFLSIGNDMWTMALKQAVDLKSGDRLSFRLGYDAEVDDVVFYEEAFGSRFLDNQRPWHHAVYAGASWSPAERWNLQFGARFNYQTASEHFGVEPRFSASWAFAENRTLEFYAGRYLQYLNSIVFGDMESLNEFYYPATSTSDGTRLEPSRSNLFAVAYLRKNLFGLFDVDLEAYYKTLDGLNTYHMGSDSSSGEASSDGGGGNVADDPDFNLSDYFGTMQGYSLGWELSVRHDEGPLFGGISFSQGTSVLKDDEDRTVFFANWHQPYAVKLDFGVNWRGGDEALWRHKTRGRYLRSSLAAKYSAGMPYTEQIGYLTMKELGGGAHDERLTTVPGTRNGARQDDYFRVDLKLIDVGREDKWNFSWTIINLTDRDNVFYTYYDTRKKPPVKKTVSQFPFLPVMLNYEYFF